MLEVRKRNVFIWVLAIVFLISWGAVCYLSEDWDFAIADDAKSRFAEVPGSIAIVDLEQTREKDRVLLVRQGVISVSNLVFEGPLDALGITAEPPSADRLPHPGEDRVYRGPYQTSPDGRYLAVSVRHTAEGRFTHLAILDARTYAELGRIDILEFGYIKAVAWSPDSSRLAMLRDEKPGPMTCPWDVFSYLVLHPIARDDYYLEIFNPEGELLASAKLASQMQALGTMRLVWF